MRALSRQEPGFPRRRFDQMETWLAGLTLVSTEFRDMGLKGNERT